jgi:hypothetical protein
MLVPRLRPGSSQFVRLKVSGEYVTLNASTYNLALTDEGTRATTSVRIRVR